MANRTRKIVTPVIDPQFASDVTAMFAELCDLQEGAPVTLEPYDNGTMIEAIGTLWDGRPVQETYKREGADTFVIKALGCRYRVIAGDFWNGGRKRKYAAFLVAR